MKPSEALATHRDKLLAIAAAHGASNLRVFGSVAKGADREGSDRDARAPATADARRAQSRGARAFRLRRGSN